NFQRTLPNSLILLSLSGSRRGVFRCGERAFTETGGGCQTLPQIPQNPRHIWTTPDSTHPNTHNPNQKSPKKSKNPNQQSQTTGNDTLK
ncbi:hypothetical protein, partial [Asaia lannensis]